MVEGGAGPRQGRPTRSIETHGPGPRAADFGRRARYLNHADPAGAAEGLKGVGTRRVRPGLRRPASSEGGPASLASLLVLAAAVGAIVGIAAAGGQGPFAALRPAHAALADNRRPVLIDASGLFPPPTPGTVYRQVDVYDPAPPAAPPRPVSAPPPAPSPPPVRPSPVPSPTDDGGGGGGDS